MPIQHVAITNQLAWLPDNAGAAALSGLPSGYEVYLKLLPPLGIDRNVPINSYSFTHNLMTELNTRVAFWNEYGIAQGRPTTSRLQRIMYQEVAATLGLPYDVHFGNATISQAYGGHWPPHLGSSPLLTEAFVQQLVQATGPATNVFFYGSQAEGNYEWNSDGFPTDWLELGTLADLPEVHQRSGFFPTYVFAIDHSWYFYQAELTEWLTIGCTKALADALLAHPDLEAFQLTS